MMYFGLIIYRILLKKIHEIKGLNVVYIRYLLWNFRRFFSNLQFLLTDPLIVEFALSSKRHV